MKTIDIPTVAEEGVTLPHYASSQAAGADVRALLNDELTINPGTMGKVPTGLKLEIPEGFEIQVRPRSGLAFKHNLTVLNSPGTIDADYRGEVMVLLFNHGSEPFVVTPNMRIGQLILAPVIQANYLLANQLATTERGSGGFGHTGTH